MFWIDKLYSIFLKETNGTNRRYDYFFQTINPENSKFRNSKWATVSYKVNGRTYQSQNCIQVPMASQIGTTITVRYDTQNPEKNCIVFPFYELLYHLRCCYLHCSGYIQSCYKIRRIEIMPHFPGWFVAICVLLPVSNVIYKKHGRTIRKNSYQRA